MHFYIPTCCKIKFYKFSVHFLFRLNNSLLSLVAISAPENTFAKTSGSSIVRTLNNGTRSYSEMTNPIEEKAKRTQEASQVILQSDIVCFDVDSTVIKEEGIDELAAFCGKGQEVSRL